MESNWIAIHRKLQEHWVWQNPKYLKWWLTILFNVNYEEKEIRIGKEDFTCNPGQSFRSLESWSVLFGCSKKTAFNFFKLLEKDEMIIKSEIGKGNRRKHLLEVVNWDIYQPTGNPKVNRKVNRKLPPIIEYKKERNNISVIFENFRKEYPGTKRGLKTELDNFKKKNSPEIVNLLLPALQKEISHRNQLQKANGFCPAWKNLATWINKKCWENEFEPIKPINGNSPKGLESAKGLRR